MTYCLGRDLHPGHRGHLTAWTAAASSPFAVTSIACASDQSCTAFDGKGHASTLTAGTWSTSVSTGSAKADAAVGCRAAASCEIVDADGYVTSLTGGTATTSAEPVDPTRGGGAQAVSCAGGLCALLDVTGNVLTRSGSQSWSDPVKLGSFGVALSCATSSWCLATTAADVFRFNGSTWQQLGAAGRTLHRRVVSRGRLLPRRERQEPLPLRRHDLDGSVHLRPHRGRRVVLERRALRGRVRGRRRGPSHRHHVDEAAAAPRGPDADTDYYLRIVCPTDTRCLLVGPSVGGVAQLDGSTWKLTPHVLDGLEGLACASATRCIDISSNEDTNQQPITSTANFDGTSWSAAARFPYGDLVASDDGTVAVAASSPTTWLASAERLCERVGLTVTARAGAAARCRRGWRPGRTRGDGGDVHADRSGQRVDGALGQLGQRVGQRGHRSTTSASASRSIGGAPP